MLGFVLEQQDNKPASWTNSAMFRNPNDKKGTNNGEKRRDNTRSPHGNHASSPSKLAKTNDDLLMEPPATIPHQVLNFPMSASAAAASSEQKSEAKPEVQSSSIILGAQPDTPGRDEFPEKVADDLGAAIAAGAAANATS